MKLSLFPRYAAEIWRHLLVSANYHAGNYQDAIWLVGDGRSGTTWLSELLNGDAAYRDMFEPFHPSFVRGMTHLPPYPYQRPGQDEPAFTALAEAVFTGKFRNGRVDAANRRLRYRGLMIKDVQANLFLAWAVARFPQIKPVFLLRHPFAVAVSKRNVKGGIWLQDPKTFLTRGDLVTDHLKPFVTLIENVSDDFFEHQVMIWAIVNYVPLQQLRKGQVTPVFYEQLLSNPQTLLPPLLQQTRGDLTPEAVAAIMGKIARPSKTAFQGSHVTGKRNPLNAWQDQITDAQLKRGLAILEAFGLNRLYAASAMPLVTDPFV